MTWFCVRSATRREKTAAESLRELGFDVYLPCEVRWVRHARQKTAKASPLFAGYLFARIPQSATWTPEDLAKARGGEAVHAVIFAERIEDGTSVIVPLIKGRYIDAIWEAEAEGKFDRTLKDKPKPKGVNPHKKGDAVKIIDGPFAGFAAQVTQVRGNDRVNLLVSLFGRVQDIEVAVKTLEAA